MVAISLYRGNLHRVPDVPRRWPMPPRAISVGEFRVLLDRRSRALAQLQASGTATDAEEMPRKRSSRQGRRREWATADARSLVSRCIVLSRGSPGKRRRRHRRTPRGGERASCSAPKSIIWESDKLEESKAVNDSTADGGPAASIFDGVNDIEQRKRDLEKKLDVLNEKKHHLVQMLKQILNAEEEMKKRTSIEPPSIRASFPSQADATTDTGSTIKIAAPRMTVEVNFGVISVAVGSQKRLLAMWPTRKIAWDFMVGGEPHDKSTHGFYFWDSFSCLLTLPCRFRQCLLRFQRLSSRQP
ncbi:unnamed protein product [Spirodela intermedia]|uniref:Uncharacterized protein n=1 Tax=Spirodela intermedia TaxID=51605 RepID=A0A7I8JB25_SPIIN|nr:unnamed protein product [Spirodela intermedia]CAA6667284.1 unnamed protein product [Spirodela intermedia]